MTWFIVFGPVPYRRRHHYDQQQHAPRAITWLMAVTGRGPLPRVTCNGLGLDRKSPEVWRVTLSRISLNVRLVFIFILLETPVKRKKQCSAGSARLYLIGGSWAHPSPQGKRHLDRFSRFCRVH